MLVCALTALAACDERPQSRVAAPDSSGASQAASGPLILALGDSLTEGLGVPQAQNYPSQLERLLHENGLPRYRVINAGLSGETTTGLKNRLNWVMQQQPKWVILTTGANDAMRGIPLAEIEKNLSQIITDIQQRGARVVLGGMQIYRNLGEEYVQGFNALYPRLAQQHDVPLIPFFLDGVAAMPELNNADGIHPNADGYTHIVEHNIWPILHPLLKP